MICKQCSFSICHQCQIYLCHFAELPKKKRTAFAGGSTDVPSCAKPSQVEVAAASAAAVAAALAAWPRRFLPAGIFVDDAASSRWSSFASGVLLASLTDFFSFHGRHPSACDGAGFLSEISSLPLSVPSETSTLEASWLFLLDSTEVPEPKGASLSQTFRLVTLFHRHRCAAGASPFVGLSLAQWLKDSDQLSCEKGFASIPLTHSVDEVEHQVDDMSRNVNHRCIIRLACSSRLH